MVGIPRDHTLTFSLPGSGPSEDPVTGFPIPGTSGEVVNIPCRFVPNKTARIFRNQDNEEVQQRGRIRVDIGSVMPSKFTHLKVTEGSLTHFEGPALEVYAGGTLTGWRIEV